jgi:hypothetical protein
MEAGGLVDLDPWVLWWDFLVAMGRKESSHGFPERFLFPWDKKCSAMPSLKGFGPMATKTLQPSANASRPGTTSDG